MAKSPTLSVARIATPSHATPADIQTIRAFNRFYTQRIGVLAPYLGSELSLTEVRVLYALAHRDQPTASELGRELALDAGYLSRILRRFEGKGWLARAASVADARQSLLKLTPAGHEAFAPLEQQSSDEAQALLASLTPAQQAKLVAAMNTVQALLASPVQAPATRTVILRDHKPGDIGWVVQQHGEIYSREYGWSSAFESMVADIAGEFLRNFKPNFEKCWIAELDGARVGAVFVVRKSATVAQLRMLILSPEARGLGLGGRLTDECITFARSKSYKKMLLWTNSGLNAARAIYAKRGFKLIKSEAYTDFGHNLVGETWSLQL